MTLQEEYSAVVSKFLRSNQDNKERLHEMVFWLFNPSRDYDPAMPDFQVGDSVYHIVQLEGIWEIQIKDLRGRQVGFIIIKDGSLFHSNNDSSCVVIFKRDNALSDMTLYNILLDNF